MRMIAAIATAVWVLSAPVLPLAAEPERPAAGAPPAAVELDGLFASLKAARDRGEARTLEARIWTLWLDSGDAAVNRLMDYTIAAMNVRAYPLAVTYLDAIVAMKPDFAEGWNKRATVHWLMGDYPKSLADIDRTLALEPRHWGALAGLGMIMRDLGETQKAADAFRRALDIDPNLDDVRAGLRSLEDQLGKDI